MAAKAPVAPAGSQQPLFTSLPLALHALHPQLGVCLRFFWKKYNKGTQGGNIPNDQDKQ